MISTWEYPTHALMTILSALMTSMWLVSQAVVHAFFRMADRFRWSWDVRPIETSTKSLQPPDQHSHRVWYVIGCDAYQTLYSKRHLWSLWWMGRTSNIMSYVREEGKGLTFWGQSYRWQHWHNASSLQWKQPPQTSLHTSPKMCQDEDVCPHWRTSNPLGWSSWTSRVETFRHLILCVSESHLDPAPAVHSKWDSSLCSLAMLWGWQFDIFCYRWEIQMNQAFNWNIAHEIH